MRTAVLTAFLLLVSVSGQAEIARDIQGAWRLAQFDYSDGRGVTPGSLGYTVQLQFSADGTFLRYHDLELVEQSTWGIQNTLVLIDEAWVCIDFVATGVGDLWEPEMILPNAILKLRTGADDLSRTETYLYLGPVSEEASTWGSVKAMFR